MHCNNWIFDMDGTLTDSMTVVWEGAPDALLRRYGRTPRADLRATLLSMGMQEGARYLIREYDLLEDGGLIIAEHRREEDLPEQMSDFEKIKERKYGTVVISIYS